MLEAATDHIGPYELRGELGRGAMARVWRAWDPNLEREVAVKEPLFDPRLPQATLDEMARRFVAEARAVARLNHPNIVGVYATDVWDGRPAIVMELVEGVTLTDLLSTGPLPADQALAILDQLLDAVGYAHDRGVVHRDIKPDNVFVSREGVVKLADFGVAHVEGAGATRMTIAGSVLGTPGYMSPEQATGRAVDARSDLFSIGVVAYEMLAGENPFGAGSPDATTLIYRIVHEPAPALRDWLPSLPGPMAGAIMAALEKDPDDRPASARALKAMLHGEDPGMAGAPTGVLDTVPRARVADAGSATGQRETGVRGALPGWLPYVAVAAVCTVGLVVVLLSALSGGGGGGGSQAGGTTTTTTSETTAAEESSADASAATTTAAAQTYTLGLDNNTLAIFDHAGTVVLGEGADVSCLPLKDVARLEQGVAYDSYDKALEAFESLGSDAQPDGSWQEQVNALPSDSAMTTDSFTQPFWGIVVVEAATVEEAQKVADASETYYGLDCEVVHQLDWTGLLAHYAASEVAGKGNSYVVMTGCCNTYRELVENYLKMSEIMGVSLGDDATDLIESDDNWKLIDEMGDDIRFSGTSRKANG